MLEIKRLSKAFKDSTILSDISGNFSRGCITAVLGSSGVGKTTLLRIIAGLEKQDTGQVELNGQSIDHLEPEKRNIVYMSQQPLLFPHLNVWENVAFGLQAKGAAREEAKAKAETLLEAVFMAEFSTKDPAILSGGQKQRIAFIRAIAVEPEVLLLDEPFAALDSEARNDMQQLFGEMAKERELTAIFVTHDLKEAVTLGQQIGVLGQSSLDIYPNAEAFFLVHPQRLEKEKSFWNQFKG